MKVSELIAKLKEYPDNAEIIINYPEQIDGGCHTGNTCEADIDKITFYEGLNMVDIDVS